MMRENTPFLSRIHTEKFRPLPASWKKVPNNRFSPASIFLNCSRQALVHLFTEQYEAYMKQQEVTFKSEVTTTVIQEPTVFVSQTEQRQVTTPVSVVSEKVRSLWTSWRRQRRHRINVALPVLQEFLISAFEGKIIQEIELRIMSITYRELVTEDRELMVTAAEGEAEQPAFDTPVKNYRIMEGMGVTFHCKMSGRPLPKVELLRKTVRKESASAPVKQERQEN